MVLFKLLGYGVGSVLMYWGLLLLLIGPWVVLLVLIALTNSIWNHITGRTDEWTLMLKWAESLGQLVSRFKVEWIGWIPGTLIQTWYAGYAANLVHISALENPKISIITFQFMGVLGVVIAAMIFYWLYHLVVDFKLNKSIYVAVGGISLMAYLIFLQQPQVAEVLAQSWQQTFASLLSALI